MRLHSVFHDPRTPARNRNLAPLPDQATWEDFVRGLRARDDCCRYWESQWDVLGETHSYLHTILTGREVARLPVERWQTLTQRECRILWGLNTTEGIWGLLGSLLFAPVHVLTPASMPEVEPTRTLIREQMEQVINATDEVLSGVAHEAVQPLGVLTVSGLLPPLAY